MRPWRERKLLCPSDIFAIVGDRHPDRVRRPSSTFSTG